MLKITMDQKTFYALRNMVCEVLDETPANKKPEKVFWMEVNKDGEDVVIDVDSKFVIKFLKQVAWSLPSLIFNVFTFINSLRSLDRNLGRVIRESKPKDEDDDVFI